MKLKEHTDVISSCSIFALNSVILASKCFPKIPKVLPRLSHSLLSYTGIIWLNVQIKDLTKFFCDAKLAYQAKDYKSFFYSLTKVALKALEIFLTCVTFTATLFALASQTATATAIYAALQPLALPGILLPISLDFAQFFTTKTLVKKLEEKDGESILRISSYAKNLIENKKPLTIATPEEQKLGRNIVRQLDSYTLEHSKDTIQALDTQLTVAKADVGLRGLGYAGMWINRRYPESVAQAGVNWQMSFLYTLKLLFAKIQTANQAAPSFA